MWSRSDGRRSHCLVRPESVRLVALVVAATLAGLAVGRAAAADEKQAGMEPEFGLRAEHGEIAVQDDAVSMYSDKSLAVRGPSSSEWSQEARGSQALTVRLAGTRFERSASHLDASAANRPGLCDRLNQIDLGPTILALRLLPAGARAKDVKETTDVALVVYSMSKDPVAYDVRLAVLDRADRGRSYRMRHTELVTDGGHFCGAFLLGKGHLLVVVDEPAGSSDYLVAYGYAIKH